jgi:hypothetical protein
MRKWGYRKGSAVIEDLTFEDTQGLTSEQLAMLEMLADGPGFMRWYRRKALHQIIEESQWLIRRARQAVRIDKFVSACSLRDEAQRDLASSPAFCKTGATLRKGHGRHLFVRRRQPKAIGLFLLLPAPRAKPGAGIRQQPFRNAVGQRKSRRTLVRSL